MANQQALTTGHQLIELRDQQTASMEDFLNTRSQFSAFLLNSVMPYRPDDPVYQSIVSDMQDSSRAMLSAVTGYLAGTYGIALPAGQNIATVNYFSTFLGKMAPITSPVMAELHLANPKLMRQFVVGRRSHNMLHQGSPPGDFLNKSMPLSSDESRWQCMPVASASNWKNPTLSWQI